MIFAASMSSTASELNALASTTIVDVYHRFGKQCGRPASGCVSKVATVVWGGLAILFAEYASRLGSLVEAVNILGSLFYGTILGVFLLAFYVRGVGGTAVFLGALAGEAAVILCFTATDISFLWYNVVGCLGNHRQRRRDRAPGRPPGPPWGSAIIDRLPLRDPLLHLGDLLGGCVALAHSNRLLRELDGLLRLAVPRLHGEIPNRVRRSPRRLTGPPALERKEILLRPPKRLVPSAATGLRAPFSQERLSRRQDSRVAYHLRRPWPNAAGATGLILDPTDLLRRLAALVPAPSGQGGRRAGRASVGARAPVADDGRATRSRERASTSAVTIPAARPCTRRRRTLPWARLLRRVFFLDALSCPRCDGPMVVLALISEPQVVRKILLHLGLQADLPPVAPPSVEMSRSCSSVKMPSAQRQAVRHPETAGVLGRRRKSPFAQVRGHQPASRSAPWFMASGAGRATPRAATPCPLLGSRQG